LTVFVDLSLALAAGVVLASLMFAHKMANTAETRRYLPAVQDDVDEFASPNLVAIPRPKLPPGVEVFQLSGPFFFAAAMEFEDLLSRSGGFPKVLILRMANVPMIDASGANALKRFVRVARGKGTAIILAELSAEPAATLANMDVALPSAVTFESALALAAPMARA
jgi:SulP family sulfate permease